MRSSHIAVRAHGGTVVRSAYREWECSCARPSRLSDLRFHHNDLPSSWRSSSPLSLDYFEARRRIMLLMPLSIGASSVEPQPRRGRPMKEGAPPCVPLAAWPAHEARLRAAQVLFDPPSSVHICTAPLHRSTSPHTAARDPVGPPSSELGALQHAATTPIAIEGLRLVGGVDISFFTPRKRKMRSELAETVVEEEEEEEEALGALVILTYPALTTVHVVVERVRLGVPYAAGYLGFREAPVYQLLFSQLPPDLWPQVVMVDGNGVLHPRGVGSACHLGVAIDLPTVGVAKSLLHYDADAPREKHVKLLFRNQPERAVYPLRRGLDPGPAVGVALRPVPLQPGAHATSTQQAHNPVFVSQGHKVSLSTAIVLVRACSRFRVPEPIRQADMLSRQAVREARDV